MRTRPAATKLAIVFALATLVPFATGCSKSPKDKLQGKWVGEKIDNVPIDQEARATGWVKGTTFEFKGEKVIVTIPAEEPRTGSYAVSAQSSTKMNVSFTRANGDVDEASFTLASEGKVIKWDIGNDRTVTLSKALLSPRVRLLVRRSDERETGASPEENAGNAQRRTRQWEPLVRGGRIDP